MTAEVEIEARNRCELCERKVSQITIHHLVPRSQAKRRKGSTLPTAKLCPPCHKQLHALFSNRDLKMRYAGIEELKAAPEMQKFLNWVRKQDPNKRVRVKSA